MSISDTGTGLEQQDRTADYVGEGFHRAVGFVYIIQARYLDQPPHIMRVQLIVDNPASKFVPLVLLTTIDAESPLAILGQLQQR